MERLQAEFTELTTSGRIEIARAIERARELGDLSENGDYQAAKISRDDGGPDPPARVDPDERHGRRGVGGGVVGPGMIVTLLYDGDPDDMAERYLFGHSKNAPISMSSRRFHRSAPR